ncbi:MAG: hypothetical protein COB36_15025 [Alphaproteobacteria bacterium]|nr:MAG: hypothetical protein COB36_15025 [Alphaproteobacteria bacterium]
MPINTYGIDLIETISLRANIKPQKRFGDSVGFQFYDYGAMPGDEGLEQAILYKAWVARRVALGNVCGGAKLVHRSFFAELP